MRFRFLMLPVLAVELCALRCLAEERYESFDRDPAWDGHNNRGAAVTARFDRFGIVTTWIGGNAQSVYFDDVSYTHRQP